MMNLSKRSRQYELRKQDVIKCLSKVRVVRSSQFYISALKILAFHFAQYAILIGLSIFMFVLANFFVLYRDLPPLMGNDSHLRLQPGMSVLPRPDSLTSLIRYRIGRRYITGAPVHDLIGFLQTYERYQQGSRLLDCSKNVAYMDHPKYSCKFPIDQGTIGCNIGNLFGYDEEEPCIIVRLNKVLGWVPSFSKEAYNESSQHGFPGIKIKCDGATDADRRLLGKICYFDEESASRRGEALMPFTEGGCSTKFGVIRNYYYPYKKQKSYQNPFIWVKFYGISRNMIIMVRCWAIADNIEVDFEKGTGSVQFEMLVD